MSLWTDCFVLLLSQSVATAVFTAVVVVTNVTCCNAQVRSSGRQLDDAGAHEEGKILLCSPDHQWDSHCHWRMECKSTGFVLFSFYVSEAKDLATSYEVKYIETSCVLKHNVDELLVGVTKQILLRKEKDESGSCSNAGAGARSSSSRVTQYTIL